MASQYISPSTPAIVNVSPSMVTDGHLTTTTDALIPLVTEVWPAQDADVSSRVPATVLLPAYNEELGLSVLLPPLLELSHERFEVLVVDDGSTDATALVAQSFGCRVVRHSANAGKGVAVRTGVEAARGDKVIIMDADDTYPVDAVLEIISRLDECEMVVGVRTLGRDNIPVLNRFGNAVLTTAIRLASGSRWTDPLTGLYGLRRTALQKMDLSTSGFGLEAEIVMKSVRLGLRVVDHPIVYRARAGVSKLHPIRDGMRIAAVIASLGLRRFVRGCATTMAPFFP